MSTAAVQADAIDRWLPQTQCTRCGYPRCRDYANAIAAGDCDINRCPPGGDSTIDGLATLLGRASGELDPEVGAYTPPAVASIREAECIGCTLCIQVCPVDAIVGAGKLMHTVITDDCTGCELCIAPCPMDCIDLVPVVRSGSDDTRWPGYRAASVSRARERTEQRLARNERNAQPENTPELSESDRDRMRDEIAAAVERGRKRRAGLRSQQVTFGDGAS